MIVTAHMVKYKKLGKFVNQAREWQQYMFDARTA